MTVQTAQSSPTVQAPVCMCATGPSMSVPEAARLIRRSREYLYSGLRAGRFPGTQFGRSWAMPREFVEGFVREVLQRGLSISFEDYAIAWRARSADEVAV
jgi:excisionase family DNA binding protein